MAIQAISPAPAGEARAGVDDPKRSLLVASLLTMSGGFLDAFTWLSLDGVFASSQTGNVALLGIDAMSGQWRQAAHHLLPIIAFLFGASLAIRIRAPLHCLAGEIVCLAVMMPLLHRIPDMIAMPAIAFGVALRSASFRQVEHWQFLTVTVTGNMLRAIDESVAASDGHAAHGTRIMFLLCLMFLAGAAVGGCATKWMGASSLALPITSSMCVLWLCRPPCHVPRRS